MKRLLAVTTVAFLTLLATNRLRTVRAAGPGSPAVDAPQAAAPGLGPAPAGLQRATPRESVLGFIDCGRAGDYAAAAHYLDLASVPEGRQALEGPRLARRLKSVLDRTIWIDPEDVSDQPVGRQDDGLPADQEGIGSIPLRGRKQEIRLVRHHLPDGAQVWIFSSSTVRSIDALYAEHGAGWLEERLPAWLQSLAFWEFQVWQILGLLLAFPFAYAVGTLIARVVRAAVRTAASKTHAVWDDGVSESIYAPVRLLTWAGLLALASTGLDLSVPARALVGTGARIAAILALGLFAWRAVRVAGGAFAERLVLTQADGVRRRSVETQVNVLKRLASAAVWVVTIALVLAQFPAARTVGVSLLASAGIAGAVLGFAAQSSVANLFAGIQIMLTQPIRIDDVVVVEGEWGSVEEINFTHVVIRIWDLRRLVVPISYFLQKPFQNWTRVSPDLLGSVFLYTDHAVDLEGMRRELDRVLEGNPLWDGKVKEVVVTDVRERVVEVRALVSAADSGKMWDLRCQVRERLLGWLQKDGEALPRVRLTGRLDGPAVRPDAE